MPRWWARHRCALRGTESVGRVAELGVVPARRGAGLGFALLHDGFRELHGRGAARIVLDVDAENGTSAPALRARRDDPAARLHDLGEAPGSAVPRRP